MNFQGGFQRFKNLPERTRNLLIVALLAVFLILCFLILRPDTRPPAPVPPTASPAPVTATQTATDAATAMPAGTLTPTSAVSATQTRLPTLATAALPAARAKAFPGAEGFGADAIGGRGGRVIEVTNLDDRGPGSLRDCVTASGPRTCIFKVGGTIMLDTGLRITEPYLTIAGQSAPGDGILLRNNPNSTKTFTTLEIRTREIIIRYLTVRAGPTSGGGDAVGIYNIDNIPTDNIVLDHCSFSWGVDEVFGSFRDVHDISLQWNVIAEGLECSVHEKGCHSKGTLLGGPTSKSETQLGAYNLSFHHNLLTNSSERGPLISTAGVVDLVNNVSYNAHGAFSIVHMEAQSVSPVNYVNNYFKAGPHTPRGAYGVVVDEEKGGIGVSIYIKGNISPSRFTDSQPDVEFVDERSRGFLTDTRHAAAPVTTTSAEDAYKQVLNDAGSNRGLDAQGRWFPRQDAVDQRIIAEVKEGSGKTIDAPGASACPDPEKYPDRACIYLTAEDYTRYGITAPIGADGWPVIAGGEGYPDADHDGMPDEWETLTGFEPYDPNDGPQDPDNDGFTNLEEFLNGTNPAD